LLGEAHAVEVHVIADRVTLVHRSVVPSLYALVRRGRELDDLRGLSAQARTALSLLQDRGQVTAGDVRERLGLRFDACNDPAYAALGELTRLMLVDRGPFEIPKAGIPYLSTEGYPYHLLRQAHPELVATSRGCSVAAAAEDFLEAYLEGAVFARTRKLAGLFRRVLSPEEIDQALQRLSVKGRATLLKAGQNMIALHVRGSGRAADRS